MSEYDYYQRDTEAHQRYERRTFGIGERVLDEAVHNTDHKKQGDEGESGGDR